MTPKSYVSRLLIPLIAGSLLLSVLPLPGVSAASLDVTANGADGGDTADDTAAINGAIQAAAAGDTVLLPSGTYYVSAPIVGKSGVKLAGEDRDTTFVKYTGTTDAAMLNLSGTTGAEVTGLTFDGNGNSSVTRAILGEPAHGAKIYGNRFGGLVKTTGFGPFGVLFSGSDNVEIADNDFFSIGTGSEWGGAIRVGWGSDNAQIVRNTIADTGRGGIFVNDNSTGSVIRENVVTGSGLFKHGLSIELHTGANRSIVEDNVVDHWISVVISDFNAIRRNVVRATDGTYKSYGLEISSGNSVVTDNWVDGGQHLGISSSPARDFTYWGYNRIENMIQWGMQLQGAGPAAMNNHQYFYRNRFLNTDKDNPLAVYGDYAGYGVRLHGYSSNITFDGNEISGNDRYGINITDTQPGIDRISFVNNTITDNGMDTIDYYPPESANLEWNANTVSGNNPDVELASRGFANVKPVANFTGPSAVFVGQAAVFANTSADADGTIAHNLWDFGEGLPSDASSPTYIYKEPGVYRVTLMTTDDGGRSSIKEHTVTVTAGPPDTEAPTAPAGLASPSKTDTTIDLAWTPSTDNYAVAGYDVYQGAALIGSTDGTTTAFRAAGLQPETAYTFTVKAKDAAGNVSGASNALTVTTNDPPGGGSGTIAREYWTGISGNLMTSIPLGNNPAGIQSLTSLEGPTNWADAYGARIRGYITPDVSGEYTFYVSGDDKVELWLGTDADPLNKMLIASAPDWTNQRQWNKYPSQKSVPVAMTGGQSYYVEVLHKEGHSGDHLAVGWTGPGFPAITVIPGGYLSPFEAIPADRQLPSVPVGLHASATTAASVTLGWNASTDNIGVARYDIYQGTAFVGSSSGTSFTAAGLAPETAYSFTVRAKDAAGNVSWASAALSVTTDAPDTEAPTVPSNLTLVSRTDTAVVLSWTASGDNVGVAGYDVYEGGALIGSTNGETTYTAAGLSQNTAYTFTVRARDAAGNASGDSASLAVTTKITDTERPAAPDKPKVGDRTATTVDLSWKPAADNIGVVRYEIYEGTSLVGFTAGETFYRASGLAPDTECRFTIRAVDDAGNVSEASKERKVITRKDK